MATFTICHHEKNNDKAGAAKALSKLNYWYRQADYLATGICISNGHHTGLNEWVLL